MFAEDPEVMRKGGISLRCPHDNVDMLQKLQGSSFPRPNLDGPENLDALLNVRKHRERFSNDRGSKRSLSGICGGKDAEVT